MDYNYNHCILCNYINPTKDTSKDPELFGIENSKFLQSLDTDQGQEMTVNEADVQETDNDSYSDNDSQTENESDEAVYETPAKRHIGAVYRSGFLPSYRALRSPMTAAGGGAVGGGRFSRSGRARQFV